MGFYPMQRIEGILVDNYQQDLRLRVTEETIAKCKENYKSLTFQERVVAKAVIAWLSDNNVANALGITVKEVEKLRDSVLDKMGPGEEGSYNLPVVIMLGMGVVSPFSV